MRKTLGAILGPLVLFVSLSVMAGSIDEIVKQAIEDESRLEDARKRDANRKPAGFVQEASSTVLSNPDDPRDGSAFAPELRSKTDRFVWKYVKPE